MRRDHPRNEADDGSSLCYAAPLIVASDLSGHDGLIRHESRLPNVLVKQLECDVLVTADRGIVVVHAEHNKIAFYRLLFPQLRNAIATVRLGQVVHVSGPVGG